MLYEGAHKECKLIKIEQIIEILKNNNPYPERFSKKLTELEYEKLHKICKENNINSEAAFWEWGRIVWDNSIKEIEQIVEANTES